MKTLEDVDERALNSLFRLVTATALFALLVLPEIDHEIADTVLAIAINAVWISALLHGISAAPLAAYYGKQVKSMGECAETQAVSPPFTD